MKKIGLALGGGGARGGAHIGVLEELQMLGIQPDIIAGTSIGAAVGALLAAELPITEIQAFFEKFDVRTMLTRASGLPSLTNNTKLFQLLEEFIGRPTFADLKRPLMVIATDLINKKEVVLVEGDVVSAVVASMSFPIILPPVEREGLTLIDGGLVNNTPFDVVRAHGAHFIIAVDLGEAAPYGTQDGSSKPKGGLLGRALHYTKQQPMWQVMTTVADMITIRGMNARMAVSPPDVLIQPQMGTVGLLDFHELNDAIEAGRKAAQQKQAQLADIAPYVLTAVPRDEADEGASDDN